MEKFSGAGRGASFKIFLEITSLPAELIGNGEESFESSEEDKQTSGRPPEEDSDIGESSLGAFLSVDSFLPSLSPSLH